MFWGARDGWPLRLAGSLYCLGACWLAFAFARGLWSEREGRYAAALMAFFLTFDSPAAAIPLAADLLMLVPHLAAVYLAWRGRPLAAGIAAGIAFGVNAKGLLVLLACVVWCPSPLLAAGFAIPNAVVAAALAAQGSLPDYFLQVWKWPALYAADTFLENPVRTGLARTASWLGFHATLVMAAASAIRLENRKKWLAWIGLAAVGIVLGWRFFPRYYFLLLPPMVLLAARGIAVLRTGVAMSGDTAGTSARATILLLALLAIPMIRFGPRYVRQAGWADTAMDRDSRAAAALVRGRPGDSLFVWGFRAEQFVYTGLPAAARFLECQPLTGVAADRHLFQSKASLPPDLTASHRRELIRSRPTFILDGLGIYNPQLAITRFPDLAPWLRDYREVARTKGTIIYRSNAPSASPGTP
jgi:hypothetical protein